MNGGICFIINERAGWTSGATIASALPRIAGRPCEVRVVRSGAKAHKETERALKAGFRTIVAGGGDGTVSAVASHLAGTDSRLGILPLGTFNYIAREFGIPLGVEGALRVVATGEDRLVDVGDVNGRTFLNNAGLGGYVTIVQRRERVFAAWGRSRLGAYWVILRSLFDLRRSLTLKVTVDGQVWRYRTPMAFIAKSAYQLEQYSLGGSACIAKRQLALFVAPDCGRWEMMRLALGLALGQLEPERDFALHCGSDILVETNQRHRHVICDGEIQRLSAPFLFKLRRDALRVIVPAPGTSSSPASAEPATVDISRDGDLDV